MKKLIFVYGTLRPSYDGAFNNYLKGKCAVLGEARVPGIMYDHGYPGCVFEGEPLKGMYLEGVGYPTVLGDVLELEPDKVDGVMGALDGYEGYPYLYDRVEVETKYGMATTYQINKPNTGCPILDGDWIKHYAR